MQGERRAWQRDRLAAGEQRLRDAVHVVVPRVRHVRDCQFHLPLALDVVAGLAFLDCELRFHLEGSGYELAHEEEDEAGVDHP